MLFKIRNIDSLVHIGDIISVFSLLPQSWKASQCQVLFQLLQCCGKCDRNWGYVFSTMSILKANETAGYSAEVLCVRWKSYTRKFSTVWFKKHQQTRHPPNPSNQTIKTHKKKTKKDWGELCSSSFIKYEAIFHYFPFVIYEECLFLQPSQFSKRQATFLASQASCAFYNVGCTGVVCSENLPYW